MVVTADALSSEGAAFRFGAKKAANAFACDDLPADMADGRSSEMSAVDQSAEGRAKTKKRKKKTVGAKIVLLSLQRELEAD